MEQRELNSLGYNNSFITNSIEIFIIILVILTPIAFYPYCIDVFNPAKALIAELLVVVCLTFWVFKIISQEKVRFIRSPLDFPVFSFIVICILSLLWSNSFFVSLKELPLFLAGPLLYFIIINNISDERQINRILNVLIIIGGLFGIYGIFQYNGIDFYFWIRNIGRHKVFGLFGNVNYFAEYLIVPLPIAVSLFFASKKKLKKTLLLIGILAMGGSLILTFTRSSYLSLTISLIFMFFLFLTSRGKNIIKKNKKIFIIIILAVVITITFLFVIPTPLNKSGTVISKIKERASITQLKTDFSSGRRIAIWKFTGMIIKDHLLLGSGIGTFKYNTLNYQAKFFNQGQNRSIYPYGIAEKAHNEYLQLWAEIGIIGLGIFIWLIVSYFNYGLKLLKKTKDNHKQGIIIGLMGSIVAVLIDSIFGFPLHLPATLILLWLSLGLTIVLGDKVDIRNINLTNKNSNRNVIKEKTKDKDSNFYRFKPLLYIAIILLSIFICITIARPFVARIYWYYGYHEIERDWNKGINIYKKALKWDPYLGEVYYDIGVTFKNKEFYNFSQEYLEKAERYTDHPDLPLDLAFLYLKKGLLDKASVKLKKAITYQSSEGSMCHLYSELGNIYLQLKRYKPAEVAFKNALKINSNYVNAHYGVAGAYLHQNRLDEALEELKRVVELAPDSQEAKYARDIIQKIGQEKLKVKDNN